MNTFTPTWDDIDIATRTIATNIEVCHRQVPNFDYIVGLTRGGLVLAITLSHRWDIPMIAVNYSSVHGKGDNRNHQNSLPNIYADVVSGRGMLPDPPTLLIVDDICDSGKTLLEVSQHYYAHGHTVTTAALHYKQGAIMQPDYIWAVIPKDADWVVYPWEKPHVG